MTWSLTQRHWSHSLETRPSSVKLSATIAALCPKTSKLRKEIALNSPTLTILHGAWMLEEHRHQIKRWKAFRRRIAQIRQNCEPGDPF
jgi:hypothetical protein